MDRSGADHAESADTDAYAVGTDQAAFEVHCAFAVRSYSLPGLCVRHQARVRLPQRPREEVLNLSLLAPGDEPLPHPPETSDTWKEPWAASSEDMPVPLPSVRLLIRWPGSAAEAEAPEVSVQPDAHSPSESEPVRETPLLPKPLLPKAPQPAPSELAMEADRPGVSKRRCRNRKAKHCRVFSAGRPLKTWRLPNLRLRRTMCCTKSAVCSGSATFQSSRPLPT